MRRCLYCNEILIYFENGLTHEVANMLGLQSDWVVEGSANEGLCFSCHCKYPVQHNSYDGTWVEDDELVEVIKKNQIDLEIQNG